MILSNTEIHKALDSGLVRIDPEPFPRKSSSGEKCPYQTSSVDLMLGNSISYIDASAKLPINIDLRQGNFVSLFAPHSRNFTISDSQPYMLKPHKFVLARTKEKVTFPLVKDQTLAGRVEGKSSLARCGLLVHFTAPTIHAGSPERSHLN